jgi:hypothetical protein
MGMNFRDGCIFCESSCAWFSIRNEGVNIKESSIDVDYVVRLVGWKNLAKKVLIGLSPKSIEEFLSYTEVDFVSQAGCGPCLAHRFLRAQEIIRNYPQGAAILNRQQYAYCKDYCIGKINKDEQKKDTEAKNASVRINRR